MLKTLNVLLSVIILIFIACFGVLSFFYVKYPMKYEKEFIYASTLSGVNEKLLIAVAKAESNFNKNAISKANALGVMQVLPSTAEYVSALYGVSYEEGDLFNAEKNIILGALYLKYLFTKFDETDVVLASYNAGEGTVRIWLENTNYSKDGKTLFFIPYKETRDYINKVNKAEKVYKFFWK